ncbi:hypothetical protein [Sphingobacterium sp. DR205]|uniref:hypothetical protein n=1 Tax=Sphingobacterium sp. DR205 TaxID=2713573 RepID=UPI0013E49C8C|nr:hypothetical protein [Sphingobacterium sp. DR205]QIH33507.1 hypothetical protein G6053_11685 [Sphingobacterium sp. DR205]
MFKSISWQMYLYAVSIVTCIYYLTVILLFFRTEVSVFTKKLLRRGTKHQFESSTISSSHTQVLQQKLEEVKELLAVFGKGGDRTELLAVIRSFLAGYNRGYLSDHKDALILLIATQAANLCGFELSDSEIENCFPDIDE